MEIKFFCPHWGSKQLPFKEFIEKVKDAGYDGVEMSLPLDRKEKAYMLDCIKDQHLLLIAQHWETVDADFTLHKENYSNRLKNLAECRPLFINSQTGKDFFSYDQNLELIETAREIATAHDVRIIHETHRGRFNFAAHVTRKYLELDPDLRLTLDLSHWLVVADSLLFDQQEALESAIKCADHIHARVGFPGGPQIPDPRAPEWSETVSFHISIWEKIVRRANEQKKKEMTITPEFGPFPYMTLLPFSQQPITNQWQVNVHMMNMLKTHFNKLDECRNSIEGVI